MTAQEIRCRVCCEIVVSSETGCLDHPDDVIVTGPATTIGRRVTIVVAEDGLESSTYEVRGVLFDDGRLLTGGTGTDGRDSLWSSLEEYEPNGTDLYRDHEISGEIEEVSWHTLVAADHDNWSYYGPSLLLRLARGQS